MRIIERSFGSGGPYIMIQWPQPSPGHFLDAIDWQSVNKYDSNPQNVEILDD